MRAGRVLVVSGLVHAIVIGLFVRRRLTRTVPPPREEAPQLTMVEVVPLAPAPVALPPPAPSVSGAAVRGSSVRSSASATGSVTESGVGTGDGSGRGDGSGGSSGTGSGSGHAALGLTAETVTRIVDATPPVRSEPKVSGKLQPQPGGTAVIHDRVTTVTVDADGKAHFHDKPDIDVKIKLPIPNLDPEKIRQDLGRVLTDWYRDPWANMKFTPKSDVARHLTAVPGACDSWGDLMCDDPLAPGQEKYAREQKRTGGSILGGPMDITAWLHRKFIGDPYSSRKRKLLDDTRDERISMGDGYRNEQLERSAEMMRRTLDELWRMTTDAATRKQALFELWDDCEEGEGPRAEAGQRARLVVIGWIRAKLPAGSAGAFSADEITRLDARRTSTQHFTPY